MNKFWQVAGALFLGVLALSMLVPVLCQLFAVALWPVVIITFLVVTVRLVWFYTMK